MHPVITDCMAMRPVITGRMAEFTGRMPWAWLKFLDA